MSAKDKRIVVRCEGLSPLIGNVCQEAVDVQSEIEQVPGTASERAAFVAGLDQAKQHLADAAAEQRAKTGLGSRVFVAPES